MPWICKCAHNIRYCFGSSGQVELFNLFREDIRDLASWLRTVWHATCSEYKDPKNTDSQRWVRLGTGARTYIYNHLHIHIHTRCVSRLRKYIYTYTNTHIYIYIYTVRCEQPQFPYPIVRCASQHNNIFLQTFWAKMSSVKCCDDRCGELGMPSFIEHNKFQYLKP